MMTSENFVWVKIKDDDLTTTRIKFINSQNFLIDDLKEEIKKKIPHRLQFVSIPLIRIFTNDGKTEFEVDTKVSSIENHGKTKETSLIVKYPNFDDSAINKLVPPLNSLKPGENIQSESWINYFLRILTPWQTDHKYFYIYRCFLRNAKLTKCIRSKVYVLAEKYHAKVRSNCADGIFYINDDSNDLSIQLLFKEETQSEDFQSAIRQLSHKKRKYNDNNSSDDYLLTVDDVNPVVTLVNQTELVLIKRVFQSDYKKNENDLNPSEDCDGQSTISNLSHTSVEEVSEIVKFQLLDDENSILLKNNLTEKCHLLSQTKYEKYKNNKNNIVYATRHLHEHFDGINKPNGIPSFALEYITHDLNPISPSIGSVRYETTVKVIFFDEECKNALSQFFKTYQSINNKSLEIQFQLYFENPNDFKKFAKIKAKDTYRKWNSFNGVS